MSEQSLSKTFEYGQCFTSQLRGKAVRKRFRKTDYFENPQTLAFIKQALELYGLEMPTSKDDAYIGAHHDLLFLNTHGVTIRIGNMDLKQLTNPVILQPLHYIKDPTSDFTVALYPGLKPAIHCSYSDPFALGRWILSDEAADVGYLMDCFGNEPWDLHKHNWGFVEVERDGKSVLVPLLFDMDDQFHPSEINRESFEVVDEHGWLEPEKMRHLIHHMHEQATVECFDEAIQAHKDKLYLKTFEYHQPLRRAFARAFKGLEFGQMPDQKKLNQAWDMAKNYHDIGYCVFGKNKVDLCSKRELMERRRLHSEWRQKRGNRYV
tara:strand:- start:30 stop:992 length:963 start_codon:yes stop_codon:yes gene_type:complete